MAWIRAIGRFGEKLSDSWRTTCDFAGASGYGYPR